MEMANSVKKVKVAKSTGYTSVHLRRETKKQIVVDLTRINKKDFGRTVRIDEYLSLAISLITPEHIQKLQEASLSNADKLERDYKAYVAEFGNISKDEYLGKRLSGEMMASVKKVSDAPTEAKT